MEKKLGQFCPLVLMCLVAAFWLRVSIIDPWMDQLIFLVVKKRRKERRGE